MKNKKTWFITGASRGMGVDFAKAALAAGHAVVASGRDSNAVSKALGQSNDLLAVKLDVTSRADAEAAVRAAVDRFGRIDVLVNNAASFYAGYFEELTPEQIERQLAPSLIGSMNVTRAKRAGLVHLKVSLNDSVAAGQVMATVTNIFGELVEEIRAPIAGPIVRIATFPIVNAGERIIQIGVPR